MSDGPGGPVRCRRNARSEAPATSVPSLNLATWQLAQFGNPRATPSLVGTHLKLAAVPSDRGKADSPLLAASMNFGSYVRRWTWSISPNTIRPASTQSASLFSFSGSIIGFGPTVFNIRQYPSG